MIINKKEVYRYLGYQNHMPDQETDKLVEEVIHSLQQEANPKNIQRRFKVLFNREDEMTFSDEHCSFTVASRNLAANLRGCREVILFAATLGNGPDKMMTRYEITHMAKAAISQAASAMLIEAYCDELQESIRQKASQEGYYLRPRFSPGYGDFSIAEQKKFFSALECEKRIGLTLTDSMLMLPTKSVTAMIGLTKEKDDCYIGKCKQCSKKDCEFRHE